MIFIQGEISRNMPLATKNIIGAEETHSVMYCESGNDNLKMEFKQK